MKHLLATAALCLAATCATATFASAQEIPAAIKANGLKVAIVPNYPPLDFMDPATGKLTGFDVELGEALAQKLGIKILWQETSFDQMMPAIATGRVDAIMSGMTDYKSRQETATFVDYLQSGPQFFVQKAREAEFADPKALCGKNVGASRRTNFPKEIAAWSEANCTGREPIKFVGTEGSADARTQLKQGRIDAAVQGNETLAYVMGLEPGAYAAVGKAFASQYTGLALPVKETDLHKAVAGALDALIADGSYGKLLTKWQLADNGIPKALINAGE